MKIISTKYKVAMSITTIFMLENVYMYQIVFMTTIDTMLFSVSFTETLMSYGSSIRSWTPETETPTDPIGSPEPRKITWMQFEPDLAPQLIKKTYVLFVCFCYTVLYGL